MSRRETTLETNTLTDCDTYRAPYSPPPAPTSQRYVTHSTLRFSNVVASAAALSVDVAGVKGGQGETVRVCAAKTADLKVACQEVSFINGKTTTVSFK